MKFCDRLFSRLYSRKIKLKDGWRKFRFKLAYRIAPEWIDDLEYRLSVFLCNQTGGLLSKCYYPIEVMQSYAEEYRMRECDECEYRKEVG